MDRSGKHILVLENDLATLNQLSHRLAEAGYRVSPVADADSASWVVRNDRPDAFIVELTMPGVDGFEVTRALRSDGHRFPVIAVTTAAGALDTRARAAGADAVLSEPVDRAELLRAVEEQLLKVELREHERPRVPHVLVFEDEPRTQKMMKAMLETAGFRVSGAETGTTAMEIVDEDPPDLVVCDLAVPGIDGFELITALRQEFGFRRPILVVSGLDTEPARQQARAAGADDFLAKPVDRAKLLGRIEGLLGARPG
ncbi:response regulator [candidate division WOR-3 bacterium]|nr:response regulator [candidate division WOR-3 bacterium]